MLSHMFVLLLWSFYHNFFLSYIFLFKKMAFKLVCSQCHMNVLNMSLVIVSLQRLFNPQGSRLHVALRLISQRIAV